MRNIIKLCMWVAATILLPSITIAAEPAVTIITLQNSSIKVDITPDIGGRVLHFSQQGAHNFLRVGPEVTEIPNPVVNAEAGPVGYLGHEMWVGPQSAWWTQQTLNTQRLEAQSVWPPDPYLVLATHNVTQRSQQQLVLQGPSSPVSGIAFTKEYRLLDDKPNSLQLNVSARNVRDEPVSWDIWFNTRVRAEASVYVPLNDESGLRLYPFPGEHLAPPMYRVEQGLFTFDLMPPPEGKTHRRGKVFMQPSAGWMAAFDQGQVFIIQFALQPASLIHPEQGQIELYLDYQPNAPHINLLEMEVHAPYKTLVPGEAMHAQEVWTILPYQGDFTSKSHIAFLKKHAKTLGLDGF